MLCGTLRSMWLGEYNPADFRVIAELGLGKGSDRGGRGENGVFLGSYG